MFAIQNPSLLAGVSSNLFWSFERQDASANKTVHISGGDWLSEIEGLNSSSSDPYFIYWSTPRFDVEVFAFSFGITHPNCSRGRNGEAMDDVGLISRQYGRGFFTLKNGISLLDLVAATNEDSCKQTLAHAPKVTDRLETPGSEIIHNGTSCPVLDQETPLPTPTPCKVKIDKPAAESISAAITARACLAPTLYGVECPTPTGAATRVLGLFVGGSWGAAMVGLLVSGLLLV